MSVPTPATQDRQCAPSSVRPVVIACYHYSIANPNGMSVQRNECSLSSVLRQSDPSKVRANWTLYSQSHRGRPPGGSAWLGMF
uniref:Uncharacterized protein n=1 Tax=Physcomitrium patens TaxID=3218 RepID=A0A2K1IJ63_PHYPA|nr:hypothetical protein PHYPA_028004 [Physcomitrium patens]